MTCGCEYETPASIETDDNIDVFEQIIANTEYMYTEKRAALWAVYRYRAIGHTDRAYWLQCMADRYSIIKSVWDIKWKAWSEYITRNASSVSMNSGSSEYTTTTENEDNPDTAASTTKYLDTRSTVTFTSASQSGLDSETVRDYLDAIPNPAEGFADEFRRLFYWGV